MLFGSFSRIPKTYHLLRYNWSLKTKSPACAGAIRLGSEHPHRTARAPPRATALM
jgi:hypothetical protein